MKCTAWVSRDDDGDFRLFLEEPVEKRSDYSVWADPSSEMDWNPGGTSIDTSCQAGELFKHLEPLSHYGKQVAEVTIEIEEVARYEHSSEEV